ncbi:hypothetical protein QVD17_06670 [Tagetes erecta]|uniref:Uncharacterized protein n=1 Tax=Tagetes erecta TaxID=13708 RepID=A0AAD8PBG5_TARER|nr:hypothetical protein QVD17_06670 [Tagetes erecta]
MRSDKSIYFNTCIRVDNQNGTLISRETVQEQQVCNLMIVKQDRPIRSNNCVQYSTELIGFQIKTQRHRKLWYLANQKLNPHLLTVCSGDETVLVVVRDGLLAAARSKVRIDSKIEKRLTPQSVQKFVAANTYYPWNQLADQTGTIKVGFLTNQLQVKALIS